MDVNNLESAQNNMSKKAKKKLQKIDEDIGAAVFEFKDSALGISQKFAFNLRFYKGANDSRHDGLYEFSVEGSKNN